MVAVLNEENSRACADLQPPTDSSPTSVIEKPLEPSTKLVYNKGNTKSADLFATLTVYKIKSNVLRNEVLLKVVFSAMMI